MSRSVRGSLAIPLVAVALGASGCGNSTVPDLPPLDPLPLPEPAEVDAVVFLLGDGGATEAGRSPTLAALARDVETWSRALGRDSAVSVVYPGDIVYPVGVRDRDHPDFETDSVRLWNQIDVVAGPAAQEHESLGLFLAGNHDWGNTSGDEGIERVTNLAEALSAARATGPRVALLPEPGSPGPVVRDLRRNVRLVFVDTHWFLQARSAADKDAFFEALAEALTGAGDRHVIMVQHHPYRSAGPHDALLPGPEVLGIPFLLKKTGTLVQDIDAPVYAEFRRRLRRTFLETGRPPLVFAGGHDHSLQVLSGEGPDDPEHILVSGSGSKLTSITETPGMRYGASRPGYMYLTFRHDDGVDLFVVAGDPGHLSCSGPLMSDDEVAACMRRGIDSLQVAWSGTLVAGAEADSARLAAAQQLRTPWWTPPGTDPLSADSVATEVAEELETGPPPAVAPRRLLSGVDSVDARPGETYPASRLRRVLLGDLNRHLWDISFRVPVLDLDSLGGGVRVEEISGGKQTLGLRLAGADGVTYQFRSIVKDASRLLPGPLDRTPLRALTQDQMAAQFPLAAMVVAELARAAGVRVAPPVPVVLPDDERLGPYREAFAGRMGWIEVRPDEADDDEPGFGGSRKITGSEELYEELASDPTSRVDGPALLKARLLDMLVGDWDRHSDQWRWAAYPEGEGTRWEPIPRDRDWAFSRIDGLLPTVVGAFTDKYVGFAAERPDPDRLARSADRVERRLLSSMERSDYLEAARELQRALSDSVLAAAVGVLPAPVHEVEAEPLLHALRLRRDVLVEVAAEWYTLRARVVDVWGTEGVDVFELERAADGRLTVRVADAGGTVRYERTFQPAETREVRLHWTRGEDVVRGDDAGPGIEVARVELTWPGEES